MRYDDGNSHLLQLAVGRRCHYDDVSEAFLRHPTCWQRCPDSYDKQPYRAWVRQWPIDIY